MSGFSARRASEPDLRLGSFARFRQVWTSAIHLVGLSAPFLVSLFFSPSGRKRPGLHLPMNWVRLVVPAYGRVRLDWTPGQARGDRKGNWVRLRSFPCVFIAPRCLSMHASQSPCRHIASPLADTSPLPLPTHCLSPCRHTASPLADTLPHSFRTLCLILTVDHGAISISLPVILRKGLWPATGSDLATDFGRERTTATVSSSDDSEMEPLRSLTRRFRRVP